MSIYTAVQVVEVGETVFQVVEAALAPDQEVFASEASDHVIGEDPSKT